jgi:hypothetical protein
MRRRGAVVALVVLALAGCGVSSGVEVGGSATTNAADSTTTAGATAASTSTPTSSGAATTSTAGASSSTTVSNVALTTLMANGNGTGYSVGVPESWATVDSTAGTPDEVANKIAKLFPNGADVDTLADAIRQGLVLFAIDPESGANVNVLVQNQTVSLDLLAGQIDKQLSTVGAAPANITRPTIAGREALRADTTIASPSARVTQLYVVTATQTYITTITTPTTVNGVPIEAMAASIAIA